MVDNTRRIDELKKELGRDATSRQFYQLGELLRRDGRLGEAAEVLRGGLRHHGRYVAAWVALGRTCLDLGHGREGEAAEALTQALGLDPQNPVAWRLLGEARLASGERSAALEAMERALALVPGDEVLKAAVEALQNEAERSRQPVVSRTEKGIPPPPPAAPTLAPQREARSDETPFDFDAEAVEIEVAPASVSGEHLVGEHPEGEIVLPADGEWVAPEAPLGSKGQVFDVFGEQVEATEPEPGLEAAAAGEPPGEEAAPEIVVPQDQIFAPPPELPDSLVVVKQVTAEDQGETIVAADDVALAPEQEESLAVEPQLVVPPPVPEDVAVVPEAESIDIAAVPSGEGVAEVGMTRDEIEQKGEPESEVRLDAAPEPPMQVEEPPASEGGAGPGDFGDERPASMTLARMYLHQQQMRPAVEVLERLLQREPENEEARELLSLVCDMLDVAPAPSAVSLTVAERKIASLQRWLTCVQVGREGVAP